jgi:transcriptional regulator with XRE-family HTH domain
MYKRGYQSKLARSVGCSVSTINDYLNRKKTPSPKMAKVLEEATGIDRRAWVWPDEFKNPMIEEVQNRKKKKEVA